MLSTQDIIRKHNISYQTINYYTNLGLLTVRKKKGNSRFYDAQEVKKYLENIARFKNQGYSLKLIRDIILNKKNELL
jgi:DNA-binding transcriptional MerR regulator